MKVRNWFVDFNHFPSVFPLIWPLWYSKHARSEPKRTKIERERRALYRRRKRIGELLEKPQITQQRKENLSNELMVLEHKLKMLYERREKEEEERANLEIRNKPKYFSLVSLMGAWWWSGWWYVLKIITLRNIAILMVVEDVWVCYLILRNT